MPQRHGTAAAWAATVSSSEVYVERSTCVLLPQSNSSPHTPSTEESCRLRTCVCRSPGCSLGWKRGPPFSPGFCERPFHLAFPAGKTDPLQGYLWLRIKHLLTTVSAEYNASTEAKLTQWHKTDKRALGCERHGYLEYCSLPKREVFI